MRARPRAAFVMTISLLAGAACGKQQTTSGSTSSGTSSECKPPECHMNPPPQPTPSIVPPTTNPPAFVADAGAPKAPKQ